ncbi:hypothetical protein [Aurantimonas endophytica]|uniref:DUF4345 domain-containing protein n=1 Tax=Aurantimonas endophytica TaxID=1522175 RepID=A0A7W6HGT6_9HYPH|nr:hypothetical protein [Aurantimonas endophytica]MBB4004662.1 hypothetical protein [Aurantimonas endophytica]MCO6405487.1 hypothetical protein [Aurantimonas endophytica]
MPKLILVVAALYLFAVGMGLTIFPLEFGTGAVPADAPPELVALLRLLGGPFLGIAALNWLFRDCPSSRERGYVLVANLVGFGAVAANDLWGVVSGDAREIAKVFLVIHLLFAAAFLMTVRQGQASGR